MPEYSLRLRRYDRGSGRAAYWEQFTVELDGHRSVLDAIRIRCSCRPDHIRVQRHVPREIAEAWQWMCPAAVCEIAADAPRAARST